MSGPGPEMTHQELRDALIVLETHFGDIVGECPEKQAYEKLKLAVEDATRTKLLPMGNGNQWYFDCADHYIDVVRFNDGTYSVFFRNRADQSEGWYDQFDDPGRVRTPISAEELEHIVVGQLLSTPTKADNAIDPEARQLYTAGWRSMGIATVKEIRRRIAERKKESK